MQIASWRETFLTLLRVVAGFTFSCHGLQKLAGFFGGMGGQGGTVHFPSILWLAAVLELVGGALLIVGLLTRPVALLLAGFMAVAYFMIHFPHDFWPIKNGGELAVLYCFIFLYFFAAGAGAWSLDAVLRKKSLAEAQKA